MKDINPTLQVHPDTHDIMVRTQTNAINGALINLILTNQYERPYNKNIDSSVWKLLFEDCNSQTASVLQTTILAVINNFEKRAIDAVVVVSVNTAETGYTVDIAYVAPVSGKVSKLNLGLNKQ